jgi:UDPglucose 6-dehydrogenase
MKELLVYPIVLDGRNLFDPAEMAAEGFLYQGMGRTFPRSR